MFKLVVAYEGTRYHGWQVQHTVPTVAQTMQICFKKIFDEDAKVIGASRTDTGVHAQGQVAVLKMQRPVSARSLKFAWNNVLPYDIRILDCQQVAQDYSPFEAIAYKQYHYHILTAQTLPFYTRYGWRIQRMIDYQKLHDILQLYVGKHDFRSFSTGEDRDNTVRTIDSIALQELSAMNAHRIIIKGPAFLRYMIRRMVGAAVEIALDRKRCGDEIKDALRSPHARQRFLNAPACGLTLHSIVYNNQEKQGITHDETSFFM